MHIYEIEIITLYLVFFSFFGKRSFFLINCADFLGHEFIPEGHLAHVVVKAADLELADLKLLIFMTHTVLTLFSMGGWGAVRPTNCCGKKY